MRLVFHKHGDCWRLLELPRRKTYFSGKVVWWSWWRFALVIDSAL